MPVTLIKRELSAQCWGVRFISAVHHQAKLLTLQILHKIQHRGHSACFYLLYENYDPQYVGSLKEEISGDLEMAFGDENVEDSDLCLRQDWCTCVASTVCCCWTPALCGTRAPLLHSVCETEGGVTILNRNNTKENSKLALILAKKQKQTHAARNKVLFNVSHILNLCVWFFLVLGCAIKT